MVGDAVKYPGQSKITLTDMFRTMRLFPALCYELRRPLGPTTAMRQARGRERVEMNAESRREAEEEKRTGGKGYKGKIRIMAHGERPREGRGASKELLGERRGKREERLRPSIGLVRDRYHPG